MAKKRLAAMLLVLAAVVCACGDSRPNESVGSVTTSTTTSVAVDYAKQYLDVEGPFLERSVPAMATLRAAAQSRNIPLLIEGLHEVGTITWEYATALLAQKWPEDLKPAIQKQAKMLGDLSSWERIATESDWTSMMEPIQHLGVEVVNATQVTRELLGLPKFDSSGTVLTA